MRALRFVRGSCGVRCVVVCDGSRLSTGDILRLGSLTGRVNIGVGSNSGGRAVVCAVLSTLTRTSTSNTTRGHGHAHVTDGGRSQMCSIRKVRKRGFSIVGGRIGNPTTASAAARKSAPRTVPTDISPLTTFPGREKHGDGTRLRTVTTTGTTTVGVRRRKVGTTRGATRLPARGTSRASGARDPARRTTISRRRTVTATLTDGRRPARRTPMSSGRRARVPRTRFATSNSNGSGDRLVTVLRTGVGTRGRGDAPTRPGRGGAPRSTMTRAAPSNV